MQRWEGQPCRDVRDVPGCKPQLMCCLLTPSHTSPKDVNGNEMQLERLLTFRDC
ncbi:hypothetical protein DPMN_083920 [Dreissena polymorpha]|uniref:Uncharacterized protein n=1 Tax=Dreissena polymorpha TaxID=45954 RepID=A0A9D3YA78_DREPO|nr:hypothetical protein DPMN_083920 [Dreissena polymorpha]